MCWLTLAFLLAIGRQTNSTSLVSMAFTTEPREHPANLSLTRCSVQCVQCTETAYLERQTMLVL